MNVAIIGTGISGLTAAWMLHRQHELTVYEAADWIGGHTHTVDVPGRDGPVPIDTGFIVFNLHTYPGFLRILRALGVPWHSSDMSFSVARDDIGLEYRSTNLDTLFAQRRNVVSVSFWRMLRDVLRFQREAPALLAQPDNDVTLGQYLRDGGYSQELIDWHILPLASAVWSAGPDLMRAFPARYLVQFFHNHGFLQLRDRPQWQVIRGGSREYVERMVAPFRDRIRLSTPVRSVERQGGQVTVRAEDGSEARYDRVIIAAHADQALGMLADPSAQEREVLGCFGYQRNHAVLHTDASVMPRSRRAWASWNYHLHPHRNERASLTYWMNQLQGLEEPTDYFVTLNPAHPIDPSQVLRRIEYAHPIYTARAVAAQRRHDEVNGAHNTFYCGAYWGFGFHEDGVQSALAVTRHFGMELRQCA